MASKSDLTNPNSTRSLPPSQFRFCRSISKDLNPESTWLSSDGDQASSGGYRAVDLHLVRSSQRPSSLVSTYGSPGDYYSGNSIVTVRDVRLVRYQPVIATGDNTWETRRPRFLRTGVFLLVACCCFQLPGLLREIRTADESRSAALESLALSLAHQDQRLEAANTGLKDLARQMSQLSAANAVRLKSQESPTHSDRQEVIADALESLLSKRPLGNPAAAPGVGEPVPPQKKGDQTLPPAQPDYAFNSAVPLAPGAIVHRNEKGDPDYWLIQRPGETIMARVIPLDVTDLGVSVHRVDDNRNYILTMQGGWMGSN